MTMKGMFHSEETKKMMREMRKEKCNITTKEKKKILDTWKRKVEEGYVSPLKGKSRPGIKIISPMKGKHHSEEAKRKIREKSIGRSKGEKNGMWEKLPPSVKHIIYNGIDYRSWWEAAYAIYFEMLNELFEYEPKSFLVKGCSLINSKIKDSHYWPDFYLPNRNLWIEVKGTWRRDGGKQKEKFKQFREQYPEVNIKILMKNPEQALCYRLEELLMNEPIDD